MANLKLYMTPGSCSTGIHILLEELDLIFEAYLVNLLNGDQYKPEYIAINPKSTIPVLVTQEKTPITEFSAIAWWLARKYPKAKLLPDNIEDEVKALEMMNYAVSTIHMQAFTRIFTPEKYAFNESDIERVKAQGETMVKQHFAIVNKHLADREYIVNDFSIADAALFYVEFWADRIGIQLPEHCQQHYKRMLARPAVQRVMMEEGYTSLYQ